MIKRVQSRILGGPLLVSIALTGCGGSLAPAAPQATVEPQRAAVDEPGRSVEPADHGIDLLVDMVDDPAAIVLVAGTDGPAAPAPQPPPAVPRIGILGVQRLPEAPAADASPPAALAPVIHDSSVSSASYRAAAPSAALEPAPGDGRSPAMAAIVQQATAHLRQGYELANRGAHFSARSEFVQSVRLISQGLDAEQGQGRHGHALAAGMRAIEEADDLVPRGARLEGDIDVYTVTRPHQTPVLKNIKPGELTPQAALQRYYAYAEEQLATAVSPERTASSAFYAIGKLHSLWSTQKLPMIVAADAKAVVFYQAAMLADPNNAIAANDLAVLLARVGRYAQARALLIRAVQQSPQAAVWHNLAVVHARLGEAELARLANKNALAAGRGVDPANAQAVAAMQAVKWVDPQTFAS
ncbi:MAG TPA: tetratricopeptide repeat protein, partial [Pirellulales bacterium]